MTARLEICLKNRCFTFKCPNIPFPALSSIVNNNQHNFFQYMTGYNQVCQSQGCAEKRVGEEDSLTCQRVFESWSKETRRGGGRERVMTRSTDTVRKPIASTQIPEYFNQQKILTEMLPGILFIWMMPPQFTSNINV